MRRATPIVTFLTILCLSAASRADRSASRARDAEDAAASSVLIGGDALIEVGRFDQMERVNRDTNSESDDLRDFGGGLVIGYLHGVTPGFRLGGSLTYSGFQSLNEVDGNGSVSFGQRLALDALAEGIIPLTEKMDILVGGRLGTPILIPGGDFKDLVRVAEAQQYRTNSGPRFGLRIGVDADVRVHIKPHFAIRAGVGYAWTRTWLMNSKAESLTTDGQRKYSLTLSRIRIGAGLEWLF